MRGRRWGLTAAFVLLAAALHVTAGRLALADNLADEAEVQFQIGAERYQAGDYRGALEHFLASNRLVANRNVVFNVARAYEQLKQSADAYRYYSQALEGEQAPDTRGRIENALVRMEPLVAVLRVESDPPGAAIYLGRRDLGALGETPIALGLVAGRYRVIAELPGYEPAETAPQDLALGTKTHVLLRLTQILGTLVVDGEPRGAAVRLDDDRAAAACILPCSTQVPPGRHTVFVSASGYQSAATTVNVQARATSTAVVRLASLTGALLVSSEIQGALISVDGERRGFAPAALSVPLGPHTVTVTHAGFRPFEQQVDVTADGQARVDVDLTPAEEVSAASRVMETVEDAPSSVTIITADELRAMAYPTIAEAVRGVRGVFIGDDTSYASVGFRGVAPPGDYGDHVLVLVDGQPTNDDYSGSSYVGYDARADIDDIERIEVVRGPGSVLYGTGAFFGVINLVTRDRGAPTHGEVAVSTAGNSVGHARGTAQLRLSPDAGGWMSVAAAHGSGRDFFFKEYAGDPATGGNARGVDGFDTGTVNGRVWYKAFTAQWLFTSRKKTLPSGEFQTIFGDPRTHFTDTRGLFEARFEPHVSKRVQLLSRVHLELYDFDDFLAYTPEEGGSATESFRGRWVGAEQRVVVEPVDHVRLTAGGAAQYHFDVDETGYDAQGSYLNGDTPFSVLAGYLVGDFTPVRAVKVSAGSRLDYFSNFGSSLNPRGAVIIHPYEAGNIKLLAGRAFRAPSIYEHDYAGPTQIAGGNLKPEQVVSAELEYSHRFTSALSATVAAYTNYVTDLIVLGGQGTTVSPNRYFNSTHPIQTVGGELELRREWRGGWMFGASYALQHSRYLDNDQPPVLLRDVPNSPEHLASIKAAAPIVGSLLIATTRLTLEGPRYDKYQLASDPPQTRTSPAALWDVVLSGETERFGLRYALGLYNAMDSRYSVPVSREFLQGTMVQSGRTVLFSTQVTF